MVVAKPDRFPRIKAGRPGATGCCGKGKVESPTFRRALRCGSIVNPALLRSNAGSGFAPALGLKDEHDLFIGLLDESSEFLMELSQRQAHVFFEGR